MPQFINYSSDSDDAIEAPPEVYGQGQDYSFPFSVVCGARGPRQPSIADLADIPSDHVAATGTNLDFKDPFPSMSQLKRYVNELPPSEVFSFEEMLIQLIDGLKSGDENVLIELLQFDFDLLQKIFELKDEVLKEWQQAESMTSVDEIEQRDQEDCIRGIKVVRKAPKKKAGKNQEVGGLAVLKYIDKASTPQSTKNMSSAMRLGLGTTSDVAVTSGLKTSLPSGSTYVSHKGYVRVDIPPAANPDRTALEKKSLVSIADLPDWAQPAFPGTEYLNIIQSRVYKAAFRNSANMLICAPTGAGKTNVALLAILRLIHQKLGDSDGKLNLMPEQTATKGKGKGKKGKDNDEKAVQSTFKIIYIAPMKALCSEIVDKFSSRLQHLGIQVREMTGDMTLTKNELERTHVLVTVPEKWDVMTRNSSSGSGASDTTSIQKLVELIIIDEVHLLNEDRGAVIETVVARSLRFQETSSHQCRLVGISATLPNYKDVGAFLRVEDKNIFYFDSTYRPIPLSQTFMGIESQSANAKIDKFKTQDKMDELCFEEIAKQVKDGHQCMIFVHSRMDTFKTAKKMIELAQANQRPRLLEPDKSVHGYGGILKEVDKSRSPQLKDLVRHNFGIHHAGLLRSDRNIMEKAFHTGAIKVLCCTATLAWGVNLPARCVIIKGTQVYNAEKGGFCDIGILDVLQIFGRAGRAGLDTEGAAQMITKKDSMDQFLQRLMHQIPIESQFMKNIENSLNAEIAMGNITSEAEGAQWLTYTYMYIRMFRNPQSFGITQDILKKDPTLEKKRREMISDAAKRLDRAKLIRADSNKNYFSTDLGRVATKYYLDYESAELFSTNLSESARDAEILDIFGQAKEFEQLKIRDDEIGELEAMKSDTTCCWVKMPRSGTESVPGKVAVLLQAFIARKNIESFSLTSDSNYVQQNASRLFRSMFEMALTRVTGLSAIAELLLEWAKMIDNRLWNGAHMLRHFCYAPGDKKK